MKLAVGVLCDSATVREGLLHMLGGGVTNVTLQSFPGSAGLDLGLIVVADDPQELRGNHTISVVLMNSSSREVLAKAEISWIGPEVEIPEDQPIPCIPAAVPLRSVILQERGKHEVTVHIDGIEAARLIFFARQLGDTAPKTDPQPSSSG